MNSFRADLHCHTTFSDGTTTPEELIKLAKEVGLSALSITDHDSTGAYERAIIAAKKEGIILGSGVEFSSSNQEMSVHILGYDFDLADAGLNAFCHRHIERRRNRNLRIIEKLSARGMEIDPTYFESEAEKGLTIGRPHIAQILVEKGYVRSIQEAFKQWIGDGRPCFDPGTPFSADETIEVIHTAGGKAFLAHPHLMKDHNAIYRLLEKPFDGIECYYSKCLPSKEKKWMKIAEKKGLLISGGSDYHGAIKPGIPLGCSWVGQATFEAIFQRKL